MISVSSQRFGLLQRTEEETLMFSAGIFGFELQQRWLLMGDREHGSLYWLQNIEQVDLSLSVVDPREFVRDYALHAMRDQLRSIWNGTEQLIVLSVLTEYQDRLCLNLRNPIVINPHRQLGRQIVVADDRPLQHVLPDQSVPLQKSA